MATKGQDQSTPESPAKAYTRLINARELKPDPFQEAAVEKLQALHEALSSYPSVRSSSTSIRAWRLSNLFSWNDQKKPPRGLYLYGDVGRGKSMLMDLFFRSAPVSAKRRVHFHEFMLECHARIHAWRKMDGQARLDWGGHAGEDDPIPPLARKIAQEATLLCFDEFQVSDVADAMILGRLYRELFARGVVIVCTSNRLPEDLYRGGLNRELFLPFIGLIRDEMDVVELNGPTDYRLQRLKGLPVYYVPVNGETTDQLREAFWRLTDRDVGDPKTVPSEEILVQGRKLFVPKASKGAAVFSFKRLCANPLGAADYLAIARGYHTVFIVAIPKMTREMRNEAKRFVILIDALYENGVKLICSAEAPPGELYPAGDGSFEFARTASRLIEMQSEDYLKRGHGRLEA